MKASTSAQNSDFRIFALILLMMRMLWLLDFVVSKGEFAYQLQYVAVAC